MKNIIKNRIFFIAAIAVVGLIAGTAVFRVDHTQHPLDTEITESHQYSAPAGRLEILYERHQRAIRPVSFLYERTNGPLPVSFPQPCVSKVRRRIVG